MKHKGTFIAAVALVLVCILAGGLYLKFKPQTQKGEKEITILVIPVSYTHLDVYKRQV